MKRQVVLEDGEVVVDSGPLVTTNTTEDVEQQEHTTQEVRFLRLTTEQKITYRLISFSEIILVILYC